MRVCLAIGLFCSAIGFAHAQTSQSAYTKTGGSDCKVRPVRQDGIDLGATTICKGFAGIAVTQFEDDSRVAVSYGRKPSDEPAAGVFFGPLNTIGDMLEWRYVQDGKARKPYATILRWRLSPVDQNDQIKKLDILVVTRLAPGPVCHVAYVDAEANKDANDLARREADEKAKSFRCGTDKPALIGNPGRAAAYVDR